MARRPAPADQQPRRVLTVTARASDGITSGLRVEWVSGANDDGTVKFDLCSRCRDGIAVHDPHR
jgi:hypothetical protein